MLMYMCRQCDIYFPIRRMLELHECKYKGQQELKVEADEEDENSWQVETLDENLPILAKVSSKRRQINKKLGLLLKCQLCPFSCDNSGAYSCHLKRKHNLHKLQEQSSQQLGKMEEARLRDCPHCPFATRTKSTLYSHISRSHAQVRRDNKQAPALSGRQQRSQAYAYTGYACSYCSFAAATICSLKYHSAREHGGQSRQPIIELPVRQFDCEQCDYKSNSRKSMQHHLKSSHQMSANDEGMFSCHLCSYESLSKMGVQRHISIKHDKPRRQAKQNACDPANQALTCNICSYRTFNAKVLEWHVKSHDQHNHEGQSFSCNDCDFSTWAKAMLLTHIKRNHKLDETPPVKQQHCKAAAAAADIHAAKDAYKCELCDYSSKNKHVMKVHVIRKHTDDFNHACELCGKKYKVKADLTNHMRFQHREQPIICDVCGKECRNSNLLYLHQKFAHYKPEFECPICHRRMVSQQNLDEHVVKQHEQRQDVVCAECGKSFSRQNRLKVHMRTHLGLRPYSCQVCSKSFARRNGLRQHLLIHTGLRPYLCDICGKDFTQKTGLISHRKSHPGSHPPLPRITIGHVLSTLIGHHKA